MQNAFIHQSNTLKTWMQHGMMKLHAKPSKFHVDHARNRAKVQNIHMKQLSNTICPKQQLSTWPSRKQHAKENICTQT